MEPRLWRLSGGVRWSSSLSLWPLVVLIVLVPHSNGPVEVGPALVTGITVGLLGVAMRLLSRRR